MKVLAVNAGSSSLKLQILEAVENTAPRLLAKALVERIGSTAGRMRAEVTGASSADHAGVFPHHAAALADALRAFEPVLPVAAIGHRVVHGGELFRDSCLVDEAVEAAVESLNYLAPLHNPANLSGIHACRALLPALPQVAVFDTAFHASQRPEAYTYALPKSIASRWHIRRYGFHGISHHYLCERYAALQGGTPSDFKLVTLHLGNGCSACAIDRGQSADSSMGMTPLEGLVMGTRGGDLDPGVVLRLREWERLDDAGLDRLLNHQSGLLGLSGVSNDMRELLRREQSGCPHSRLAIDVFCHRIRRYVGAFFAVLNGADALIFSGGIGENSPEIRARVCLGLGALGIVLDPSANEACIGAEAAVSSAASAMQVWVIPTNEEALIARETLRIVNRTARSPF